MAKQLAAERWKILQRAIFRQTSGETELSAASVRRFSSFGLFTISEVDPARLPASKSCQWKQYSYTLSDPFPTTIEACVTRLEHGVSLEAMMGFNNTGNICIWPAEEVLAYHCVEHRESFKGASVCELGCGMTGLAGLLLACTHAPSHVLITDGNEMSVKNVKEILEANKERFGDTSVSSDVLLWDSSALNEEYSEKFDYVICADCLFFEDLHHELVLVIRKLLKSNEGTALIFAPKRGSTLEQFCRIAERYFHVEQSLYYDDKVWRVHKERPRDYNSDLHYPLKIVMRKPL